MIDYRISVEEFESQAEIAEMARKIVQEAFGEIQPTTLLEEENNVPFLNEVK